MRVIISEVVEYDVEVPDSIDPDDEAIEQWFCQKGASEFPCRVVDRNVEIQADKWKIQTASANGWADIKVSADGENYHDLHFDTKYEAEQEMKGMSDCRAVPASTPQNDDIY